MEQGHHHKDCVGLGFNIRVSCFLNSKMESRTLNAAYISRNAVFGFTSHPTRNLEPQTLNTRTLDPPPLKPCNPKPLHLQALKPSHRQTLNLPGPIDESVLSLDCLSSSDDGRTVPGNTPQPLSQSVAPERAFNGFPQREFDRCW